MFDDDTEIHPLFEGAPKTTEFKKLRKRLLRNTREAIEHYGMIEPVCALAGLPIGRERQLHAAGGAL